MVVLFCIWFAPYLASNGEDLNADLPISESLPVLHVCERASLMERNVGFMLTQLFVCHLFQIVYMAP